MMRIAHASLPLVVVLLATAAKADDPKPPLAEYFEAETSRIAAKPLLGIDSADEWKARRPELQRQLREMIGIDPLPERSPLQVQVRRTLERPGFVVEELVYQSSPGLYVTANLYRPDSGSGPFPAVLYVCGHANVVENGLILGCKAHYQHHAEWYATHGHVCLVVDTLQLGELPGLHHGTYREGMWWWQSRGYSPAGIEAWNGIRGIDYLATRPEVDPARIGVTGRSGGGATSWCLGALDDRVAAVAPVAGITDLHDHVVAGAPGGPYPAGVIEGHCDCMFPVNTYRWDFDTLASLVAPKPLLVENTDTDPIFPEAGVQRIYKVLEKVYGWYGVSDRLGLVIGKGGHVDSEEIRHPSFAFMERWLKGQPVGLDSIDEPDRRIPDRMLRVLDPGEVPSDNRNDGIHETFVAPASAPPLPEDEAAWKRMSATWLGTIRSKVFGGWPGDGEAGPLDLHSTADQTVGGVHFRAWQFRSQTGVELPLWRIDARAETKPKRAVLVVLDRSLWEEVAPLIEALGKGETPSADSPGSGLLRRIAGSGEDVAHILVAPRGVGPLAWDSKKDTHIRRRFALLGQTLDGMRVFDVRRALLAVRGMDELRGVPIDLIGQADAASVALWAAVFEPDVAGLTMIAPAATIHDGPAFLNVERILDMPQAAALLHPRPLRIEGSPAASWEWTRRLGATLGSDRAWPTIAP